MMMLGAVRCAFDSCAHQARERPVSARAGLSRLPGRIVRPRGGEKVFLQGTTNRLGPSVCKVVAPDQKLADLTGEKLK